MGNKQENQFNEDELKIYLKEGITMNDLINLKKAFISLDKDEDGKISPSPHTLNINCFFIFYLIKFIFLI